MWSMRNCVTDGAGQGGSVSSNDVGVGVFTRRRAKGVEEPCLNLAILLENQEVCDLGGKPR